MTTAFLFPLLVSFLPLSTTIGEFRNVLATVLRRFVLPRAATMKVCMVVQIRSIMEPTYAALCSVTPFTC